MSSEPTHAGNAKSPLRRAEWFLYRYSAVIGALALMYLFDTLYFEADINRLPRVLQIIVLAPAVPAWLLQVFFGVPLLAVGQVVSAGWFWRRRRVGPASVGWRVALAVVVFTVWAATIGRFELP